MIDMDHLCEDRECIYLGQRTAGVSCKCHKTREQMLEAEVVRLRGLHAVAQPPKVPPLAALLKEVDPGLADVLTDNAAYVRVIRGNVINECARHLEASYPGHAWLNAACAAIRSLALPSTERK